MHGSSLCREGCVITEGCAIICFLSKYSRLKVFEMGINLCMPFLFHIRAASTALIDNS